MNDFQAIEQDALEAGPIEQPDIALTADGRDRVPLGAIGDPTGRERRVVDEYGPGALRDGCIKGVDIQSPSTGDRRQSDESAAGRRPSAPG